MKRSSDQATSSHGKHRILHCTVCDKGVPSNKLNRHMLVHNPMVPCPTCGDEFRSDKLPRHSILCKDGIAESTCNRYSGVSEIDGSGSGCFTSVGGFFKSHNLEIESERKGYDEILDEVCGVSEKMLNSQVKSHPIKAQVAMDLIFYKTLPTGEKETSQKCFRSICEPILLTDHIPDYLARVKAYIKLQIEEYERHGSGWIYDFFSHANLDIARYNPLSGGMKVEIPQKLKQMKSLLSINSPDNRCFLYAVVAGILHSKQALPTKDPSRYRKYLEHLNLVNHTGLKYPVNMTQIPKFEELNGLSISVFQWDCDEETAIPLKHGSGIGQNIDLLYIPGEGNFGHFILIKNFNSFMRYRTKHHNSLFYCRKCLHGFVKEENQKNHSEMCRQNVNQRGATPKWSTHMPVRGWVPSSV